MHQSFEDQIVLFVRDQTTRRRAFNAHALKALGIGPTEARDRGYPLKGLEKSLPDLAV